MGSLNGFCSSMRTGNKLLDQQANENTMQNQEFESTEGETADEWRDETGKLIVNENSHGCGKTHCDSGLLNKK